MALLDRFDCVLFDLDGVLYRGDEPVPGAAEVVSRLREARKGLAFVTNNSSKTPGDVAAKLSSLGIAAGADEVVTSALATASLLSARGGGSAFVIGETGIRKALADAGIQVVEGEPAAVDYVVVGWDRDADYANLRTASLLVQRGARLVATNSDAAYPAPDGLWPGAGALLAAVATTTGADPEVVGKPSPPLFELARERAGGGRPLFVGDRVDTDIAGAATLGWNTLLVFSGVTRRPDLLAADAIPTFLGRDARALFEDLPAIRRAGTGDVAGITALVTAARLETEGVGARPGATLVAELGGRVVGTVSLERGDASAHLRSLVVDKAIRGKEVGTLLAARAVHDARTSGARDVYIATETAVGFFARLGFVGIGRLDALPEGFREHMSFCSETAEVMRLEL